MNPSKIKVLACGRRWGKTDACAVAILAEILRPTRATPSKAGTAKRLREKAPEASRAWLQAAARAPREEADSRATRHAILAPTLDQAAILFDRVVELMMAIEMRRPDRPVKLQVRRSPYPRLAYRGHVVVARSGHLGRSLRGQEATHIVVDEAAYVPEELVTEVAMPMLATTEGSLTLISTPRGLNHFWRFFRMGQDHAAGQADAQTQLSSPAESHSPPLSIWSRRAPSSENPMVSRAYLEAQKQLISERAYRVEYEAEFLDLAGTVFRMEAIERCTVPRLTGAPFAPFFIGVDWARYEDFTAVAVVCGTREMAMLIELDRFHALTWAEQIARVRAIVERYPSARVLCDQTGTGGDVLLEQLRQGLPRAGVSGYTFTHASKARLIEGLAWMLDNGALEMEPDPQLLRELQHFEASVSRSGNRKLMARSGYHDDLVIALALACHGLPKHYDANALVGRPRSFSRMRTRYDKDRTIWFASS